jgi:hypothetical protein
MFVHFVVRLFFVLRILFDHSCNHLVHVVVSLMKIQRSQHKHNTSAYNTRDDKLHAHTQELLRLQNVSFDVYTMSRKDICVCRKTNQRYCTAMITLSLSALLALLHSYYLFMPATLVL